MSIKEEIREAIVENSGIIRLHRLVLKLMKNNPESYENGMFEGRDLLDICILEIGEMEDVKIESYPISFDVNVMSENYVRIIDKNNRSKEYNNHRNTWESRMPIVSDEPCFDMVKNITYVIPRRDTPEWDYFVNKYGLSYLRDTDDKTDEYHRETRYYIIKKLEELKIEYQIKE